MKTVAVLALQGVVPFDLGIACDVFSRVVLANGKPGYRVLVCGESARVDAGGHFDIRAPGRLEDALDADLVIVPGVDDIERRVSAGACRTLKAARESGAQLASICTGAFVLAEAGLLDGHRVTTHWAAADELSRRYPALEVDTGVLFVDEGDIVTSAGSSAGLDMCLHLVGRDYGQAAAVQAARLAVAPLHRDGGQAPFIRQPVADTATSLSPLFDWMLKNLHKPIDVTALAAKARMTPRTLARRFRDQTGTTPIQWLITQRVRRAQELLETSEASVDQVASASGFDSPVTFRARFQRVVGLTPSAYRRRFRQS
ncbi:MULTISPECIES: GlxA family transcriptional regulator [Cupriavidus]